MAKKEWSVSVPAHGYVEFVVKASSAQEAIDLVEQGEFEEGLTEYGLEYDFEDAAAGHRIKLPRLKRNPKRDRFVRENEEHSFPKQRILKVEHIYVADNEAYDLFHVSDNGIDLNRPLFVSSDDYVDKKFIGYPKAYANLEQVKAGDTISGTCNGNGYIISATFTKKGA